MSGSTVKFERRQIRKALGHAAVQKLQDVYQEQNQTASVLKRAHERLDALEASLAELQTKHAELAESYLLHRKLANDELGTMRSFLALGLLDRLRWLFRGIA